MNKVVRSISEKDSINEQTLENAFITISNLFFEKQKNSSFESIVLCLKSFSKFSELLTKEKTKNNIMTKEEIDDYFDLKQDIYSRNINKNFR